MKIIHCVESYYPAIGGMPEVVKQLSERLVKMGHDVTVVTRVHNDRTLGSYNGVKVVSFAITGNPKEATSPEEKAYVDFLLATSCDVITFFAAQQWATDLALPVLKKIHAKKVMVPTGYSALYDPAYTNYFEVMKARIHDYDMNVYLSNDYRDINFARENKVKNIIVIPNGAAADEFLKEDLPDVRKELGIPASDFLILMVGSYTGIKGHRETVELFLRSKIKRTTLLMIGHNYKGFWKQYLHNASLAWLYVKGRLFLGKKIIFNFFPRSFTVAAYKQSNLFLFPSNVECSPIVLFECAAAKLPFLATDVGNSAEIAEWTEGGLILPTSKDEKGFSHVRMKEGVVMLNSVYADKKKMATMSEKAFENWKERYRWEVIAGKYEQMYLNLLHDSH
ncbi:MAG: glycosyltransferase family 4 protein [bacterium]|nr:glycosyltransferase family 4 protein [bacterium]